jgi:very-short-patch-repair endonuclease
MHAVERAIARIGRRQDNVLSGEQLRDAGLGRGAIAHRVKAGAMQRLHIDVYLLGPAPPTQMARARAAVLACGADAVVSHRSAACLYGLLPEAAGLLPEAASDVDVTVAGRNLGRRRGIRRHRVKTLPPQDVTAMKGLRITTIARTICDLAATESARDTELAVQEALYRRVLTSQAANAVLAREPTRRGAPVIRALLSDTRLTRSEKERKMLRLIKQAQLPKPLTNVRIHGYLADLYWPAHQLVVEFDGWDAHGHRLAFESNRKRDQILVAAGLRVLRVTDRQLEREPIAVVARIAQALR